MTASPTFIEQWSNTFGPDGSGEYAGKSYWLATENWPNQNFPVSRAVYQQQGGFHTGYVPNYAVIGPEYKVYYNSYGSPDYVFPAVKDAIDEFSTTINITNPISDFEMNLNSNTEVDISDVFTSTAGDVQLSLTSVSDPDLTDVSLSGSTLSIVTNSNQGWSTITFKGDNGTDFKYSSFIVTVQNNSIEVIYSEDFEEEPSDWIYGNDIVSWRWGAADDFPNLGYWWFEDHTKFMGINADETAFDSMTVDLAISPEIDLDGYESLKLDFEFCFRDAPVQNFASEFTVSYRTSPDEDWVLVADFDDYEQLEWAPFTIYLPEEAATETTQLGFYFTELGTWGYGAGFDDIVISGFNTSEIDEIDKNYTLLENYPNPFNPSTTIKFQNRVDGAVNLSVFNSMGQIVTTLVDDNLSAGTHSIKFDGSGLNSGVYFYRLSTDDRTLSKKMILVK